MSFRTMHTLLILTNLFAKMFCIKNYGDLKMAEVSGFKALLSELVITSNQPDKDSVSLLFTKIQIATDSALSQLEETDPNRGTYLTIRERVSKNVPGPLQNNLSMIRHFMLRILNGSMSDVKELHLIQNEGEAKESLHPPFTVAQNDVVINFLKLHDPADKIAKFASFIKFLELYAPNAKKESLQKLDVANGNGAKPAHLVLRDLRDATVSILTNSSWDLEALRYLYSDQQDFDPFFYQCLVLAHLTRTPSVINRLTVVNFYCEEKNGAVIKDLYQRGLLLDFPFDENFSFGPELFSTSFEAIMKKLIDFGLVDDAIAIINEVCQKIKREGKDKRLTENFILKYPIDLVVSQIIAYLFFKGYGSQGKACAEEIFGAAKAHQVIAYRLKLVSQRIVSIEQQIANAVEERETRARLNIGGRPPVVSNFLESLLMNSEIVRTGLTKALESWQAK